MAQVDFTKLAPEETRSSQGIHIGLGVRVRRRILSLSLLLGVGLFLWTLFAWFCGDRWNPNPCTWLAGLFDGALGWLGATAWWPKGFWSALHDLLNATWGLPQAVAVPFTGALLVIGIYLLLEALQLFVILGDWQRAYAACARWIKRLRGKQPHVRRHIIICIDGTWNHPDQADSGVGAATNVFETWRKLAGKRRGWLKSFLVGANRIKEHHYSAKIDDHQDTDAKEERIRQIALYYHGVGNPAEHTFIGEKIGGAFGFGAGRIRRLAYRDLIAHYRHADAKKKRPADMVSIFGFSRGAAIARWLAVHINKYGIPPLTMFDNPVGRKILGPPKADRVPPVDFLGVWDTVATFGVPKNILGIPFQQINLFTDFNVADNVQRAAHLVSIDERRDAFQPTLMNPDPTGRIHEVWFAGIHANVGGGYAYVEHPNAKPREMGEALLTEGLSTITFEYMMRDWHRTLGDHVALRPGQGVRPWAYCLRDPLRNEDGPLYSVEIRKLPTDAKVHWTAIHRMASPLVAYRPAAIDDLLERLAIRRQKTLLRHEAIRSLPKGVLPHEGSTNWSDEETIDSVVKQHARIEVDITGAPEEIERAAAFDAGDERDLGPSESL